MKNKLEMTDALVEEMKRTKQKQMNCTINSMEMMGILGKWAGFGKT